MKETGITRRIDDLGRIVIPKNIRKELGIREGEEMELFLMDDGVFFKKCTPKKSEENDKLWVVQE